MSPANSTKLRSLAGQPGRDQAQPDQDRPDDERERGAEDEPRDPHIGPAITARSMVRPSDHEGDDLGEAGERRVEPLDLPLVGRALVAEHDPGGEDREEPRAVGQRGDAEQQQRAGQGPQRIQALAGQRHPADEPQQRSTASHADRRPDGHLEQELAADLARMRPR